jgi:hypothetical protein
MTRARDTLILTGAITEKNGRRFGPSRRRSRRKPSSPRKVTRTGWACGLRNTQAARTRPGVIELPHLRWRIADDAELRDDSTGSSRGDEAQIRKNFSETLTTTPTAAKGCGRCCRGNIHSPPRRSARPSRRSRLCGARRRNWMTKRNRFSGLSFQKTAREDASSDFAQTSARPKPKSEIERGGHRHGAPQISSACRAGKRGRRCGARSGSRTFGAGKGFVGGRTRGTESGGHRGVLEFGAGPENPRAGGGTSGANWPSPRVSARRNWRPSPARNQEPGLEAEFVVVQGVADLVVLLPEEIWLVDFKTDEIRAGRTAGPDQSLHAAIETLRAGAGKNLFAAGHRIAGCIFCRPGKRSEL